MAHAIMKPGSFLDFGSQDSTNYHISRGAPSGPESRGSRDTSPRVTGHNVYLPRSPVIDGLATDSDVIPCYRGGDSAPPGLPKGQLAYVVNLSHIVDQRRLAEEDG